MLIQSFADWMALPELQCPIVRKSKAGNVVEVHSVGALGLPAKDCQFDNIERAALVDGRIVLPTVAVKVAGEKKLHRLPAELGGWAITAMRLVKQLNHNPFPKTFEFGILDGRHYAEPPAQ